MISLERGAASYNPLIDPSHFIGALWRADGGHCDPSGTTHAYVKAARTLGASVERFTRVLALDAAARRLLGRVTDKGTVHAEHVVNCARPVGARDRPHGRHRTAGAGHGAPLPAHRGHPGARRAAASEIVNTTDYAGEIYLRQERGGALIGTYEPHGIVWSPVTTPDDFSMQLLPDDFERLAPYFEVGFRHFPALGRVGISKAINGPFTFAPGRQSAGRAGARPAQFLGRLRRHGRLQPGRRHRAGAVALDGGGRSRRRTSSPWTWRASAPSRRPIHPLKVPENYRAPLPPRLSQRGTAGGAPGAPLADLRPAEGRRRRDGRELRSRACAVVRAARCRAGRDADLPPLRGLRHRRAECHAVRSDVGLYETTELRQVRGHRPRRARLARPRLRLPHPAARPPRARADAQRARAASSAISPSPASRTIAS